MSSEHERRRRFEAIVDEVFEPLQRYLRRRVGPADAEDALADVLMTIWRRIEDAPSPPTLPWCYGIARRTLANQRRGRERHLRLVRRIEAQPAPEPGHDPAEAGPDPELSLALDQLGDGRFQHSTILTVLLIAAAVAVLINVPAMRRGLAEVVFADVKGGALPERRSRQPFTS